MSPAGGDGGLHHVEHVMGMAVSIDIRDPGIGTEAVTEVVDWLHHVDETFSTYRDDSAISALGRGDCSFADVSEEVRHVLRLCEAVRIETGGAFDVFEVPAPNGTTLDPSGLVKGWSVERAAEVLEHHGCRNFCINAGGDIALRGRPSPAEQWRIGIRHPEQPDAFAVVVEGEGRLAVATSALYERGAHIVDPRGGLVPGEIVSATVVGTDLTLVDAYATAVFVLGAEGLAFIEGRAGYEAYVITHDRMARWTSGFGRYRSPAARPTSQGPRP